MQVKVMNEAGFQILTSAMSIGPSQSGYVLEVSADGKNFSPLFSVAANTTKMATGLAPNAYYRLKGNVGEVIVNWSRSCVTEGGANYTAGDYIDLTGDVISVTGITPDEYLTSADTANFALSADVATLSAATAGKADAANVTANESHFYFPTWNTQGIVTGTINNTITHNPEEVKKGQFNINGSTQRQLLGIDDGRAVNIYAPTTTGVTGQIPVLTRPYKAEWATPITINGSAITAGGNVYAPVSAGTAGDILVSTGNGAPVWVTDDKVSSTSVSTIWKGTQAEYDAITTKDPNTFYIIVAE